MRGLLIDYTGAILRPEHALNCNSWSWPWFGDKSVVGKLPNFRSLVKRWREYSWPVVVNSIERSSAFEFESIGNCLLDSEGVDSKKFVFGVLVLLHCSSNISAESASAITKEEEEIVAKLISRNGCFMCFDLRQAWRFASILPWILGSGHELKRHSETLQLKHLWSKGFWSPYLPLPLSLSYLLRWWRP